MSFTTSLLPSLPVRIFNSQCFMKLVVGGLFLAHPLYDTVVVSIICSSWFNAV